MALFDDASLVVTPNGYKAGTLYSIKPTSGAGDMTVVRATTATRVNSAGLIESMANNVPRLDYSNGTCPSLLVEPQRTNLLTYSSSFDNSGAWTAQTTSVSANATTAPDGTTSAETLTPSGSVAYDNRVYQTQTVTGGAVYTMSVWAKSSASNAKLTLGLQNHGGQVFNITDQWERYSVAVTALDTYGNFNIYAGDVTPTTGTINSSNVVTIWGAQLEVGSYPTSYIPTTSAAVTRNADLISKTGISSLIGQTEGTVFMDINWQQKDGVYFINSISDGTTDNEIMMAFGSTDNNRLRFSIVNGGSASVSFDSTALASGRYKVAFAYANNDAVAYINGTQVFTDNTVSVPSTSEMKFLRANNTLGYSGTINASALWKTRLTNAELISLTTI